MFKTALAHHQQGDLESAERLYRQVLKSDPKHADALHLLGVVCLQRGNATAAADLIAQAISINPRQALYHSNLGAALEHLQRLEEALESHDAAIRLEPGYADAIYNRAHVLKLLDRLDAALASYDEVIRLDPHRPDTFNNRGNVLQGLKRLEEALASFDEAIRRAPDYADAFKNRASTLLDMDRLEAALASCDAAIRIEPAYAEAHAIRGWILQRLNRTNEALASHARALEINPESPDALYFQGRLFQELKRWDAALASYQRAFDLDAKSDYLQGYLQHTKMFLCDWSGFDATVDDLARQIQTGARPIDSFGMVALTDAPDLHLKLTSGIMAELFPLDTSLEPIARRTESDRIRVGYYSSDFGEHPVSYLIAELIELHDRSRFDVVGFYYGPPRSDPMHKRLVASFDRFVDIRGSSDREIARLSRNMGIDIAIDLTGHTSDSRPGIFSFRAAPVQASYIGYLGTMGAGYYDYLLADETIIPPSHRRYYAEKIISLPSYQVNDRSRPIGDMTVARHDLGLPQEAFVFCCFSNHFKLTPSIFAAWMRILHAVPGGVLLLYVGNEPARQNLRLAAKQQGISASRLVFASHAERSTYLARYRAADLFLDTFPYNAGTTASDALWAGLPVLTLMGESFASRVASSLLMAIELPELITQSTAAYEALAIDLATNPARLQALKDRLASNRLTTALFDTPLFTRHLEAAFEQTIERYRANLPPEHLVIDSLRDC